MKNLSVLDLFPTAHVALATYDDSDDCAVKITALSAKDQKTLYRSVTSDWVCDQSEKTLEFDKDAVCREYETAEKVYCDNEICVVLVKHYTQHLHSDEYFLNRDFTDCIIFEYEINLVVTESHTASAAKKAIKKHQ